MRSLVLVLLTALTTSAFAQTRELLCLHLTPIQMRYLNRHVNFTELTPELEARTIDQIIKRLDEQKLYLLTGDVASIHKTLSGVFQKVSQQNCEPLMRAEDLYVRRVEERVAFAKSYLGPKFKLDGKMRFTPDAKNRPRAKTAAQAKAALRANIQAAVAHYVATGIAIPEAKKHVVQNFERILRRVRDLKPKDVYNDYLDSFALSLDPHSSYMSADALEDFQIQMRLSLDGIGAALTWEDGFTTVASLVPGGAAANSGLLKKKDKIVAVAQDQGTFTDVMEMEVRDVIKLIRGPRGTALRLKVLRQVAGETKTLEIPLVRDKIKLEEQAASISYVTRGDLKVAVLNLPSFYHDDRRGGRSTADDLKKLLADATKAKADALVLDLANDGGGSLPEAVDVAGLFLAKGDIVRLGERASKAGGPLSYEALSDSDDSVAWPGPLVVLTNRGSASASEIVSGALQDYRRAVVVGDDHTFGKGTMQAVENLNPGLGAVKTTTGMFFTAGGPSTQHRGVSADLVLPSNNGLEAYSEKALDYSLPPQKIPSFLSPTAYVKDGPSAWAPITDQIVHALRAKLEPRLAADKDFIKIRADLKKAKKPKTVTIASLLQKKNDEEKEKDEDNLTPEKKKAKYLARPDVREACDIAADLATELKALKTRDPATTAEN